MKKLAQIIFGVAIVFNLALVCGCDLNEMLNYAIFPGSKVYVVHLDSATLEFYDNPQWWDYATLVSVRARVSNYLLAHRDVDQALKQDLEQLTMRKGMNQQQAACIVGQPTRKISQKGNQEVWLYYGTRENELPWYYKRAKLTFSNGVLTDIEAQGIDINK